MKIWIRDRENQNQLQSKQYVQNLSQNGGLSWISKTF